MPTQQTQQAERRLRRKRRLRTSLLRLPFVLRYAREYYYAWPSRRFHGRFNCSRPETPAVPDQDWRRNAARSSGWSMCSASWRRSSCSVREAASARRTITLAIGPMYRLSSRCSCSTASGGSANAGGGGAGRLDVAAAGAADPPRLRTGPSTSSRNACREASCLMLLPSVPQSSSIEVAAELAV